MTTIVSIEFRVIFFLHEGKIVAIDQLDFFKHDLTNSLGPNIPMISNSEGNKLNLGVEIYPSLMASFYLLTPVNLIQTHPMFAISHIANESESREVLFQNNYFSDSWPLSDPSASP